MGDCRRAAERWEGGGSAGDRCGALENLLVKESSDERAKHASVGAAVEAAAVDGMVQEGEDEGPAWGGGGGCAAFDDGARCGEVGVAELVELCPALWDEAPPLLQVQFRFSSKRDPLKDGYSLPTFSPALHRLARYGSPPHPPP